MWTSESFATLELLLAFLNDHRIRAERCKIVVADDNNGSQVFYLLYQTDEGPELAAVAAQAEADPLEGADAGDAVDAAEAIIAEAHRDE